MKIHRYFLSLILVVLLIVSCSDTGLIKALMSSEYTEEIKIMNIVGRSYDSTKLYVATDKGIYSLSADGSLNYTGLTEKEAKNTLYYSETKSLIYNGDGTYTQEGIDDTNKLDGYEFIESYSLDGISFSYVLRKDGKYYIASYTASPSILSINTTAHSSLKLIGYKAYKETLKDGSYKYYYSNDTELTNVPDVELYGLKKVNDNYISAGKDGKIYYNAKAVDGSPSTTPTYSIIPITSDGLLIFPDSDYLYRPDGNKANGQRADSKLGSVQARIIIRGSDETYLIITAQNGAYILSGTSLNSLKDCDLSDFMAYEIT